MIFEFDREKFKDAMHYVIGNVGDHPGFGAIKLYKVLWFSDAKSFMLTGKPITGEEYIRRQHGPVPKHSLQVIKELENEGRIKEWTDKFHNRPIHRFKSKMPVRLNRFNKDELATLNHWMRHIDQEHTAGSISDESHDYAWEIAKMGEVLPLHAFLASRLRDPTEDDFERARRRWGTR